MLLIKNMFDCEGGIVQLIDRNRSIIVLAHHEVVWSSLKLPHATVHICHPTAQLYQLYLHLRDQLIDQPEDSPWLYLSFQGACSAVQEGYSLCGSLWLPVWRSTVLSCSLITWSIHRLRENPPHSRVLHHLLHFTFPPFSPPMVEIKPFKGTQPLYRRRRKWARRTRHGQSHTWGSVTLKMPCRRPYYSSRVEAPSRWSKWFIGA